MPDYLKTEQVVQIRDILSKVKPTLFIALGGTGAEIAFRLRRRILTHAWGSADNPVRLSNLTEFPVAQFIQFDTHEYNYNKYKFGDTDLLAEAIAYSQSEIVVPSGLYLDPYYSKENSHQRKPYVDCWLPVAPEWIKEWIDIAEERANYNTSTSQPRFFSRMGFFDEYRCIKDRIQDNMNSLLAGISNRAATDRLGLDTDPGSLRVVVISSLAGGAGSGSFIDMGYLSKQLVKRAAMGGNEVDLMLMLPSGYPGHDKTRCEANTYAALMELESCMGNGPGFIKGWNPDATYADFPLYPYDNIFLMDTDNLAKKKTANLKDILDMAADILFEDFSSTEFSSHKRSISINQRQHKAVPFCLPVDRNKYGSMKMCYSKAYSAFGQSVIETQVEQNAQEIPHNQNNDNSLVNMIDQLSPHERRSLFQNCLEMAMPWVEANPEGYWLVNPDQYVCIIGVDDARLFKQKFGDEFKSAIPVRSGITAHHIRFCETGVPGKLTCYVELSGIPLTALNQLPKWRKSYDEEIKNIPVHIHKDRTLFVHPLAPSTATLDRLAEDFKLFIQGVVLGVLKARVDDPEKRIYCLKIKGRELSIGNERLIRMQGISSDNLKYLQENIADALGRVNTHAQYSGMIALYDFYTEQVYPPRLMRDGGKDYLQDSFARVMCLKLVEEARNALENKFPGAENDLFTPLRDTMEIWTDEIKGSQADVYEYEVASSHVSKRSVKPEFFQNDRTGEHDESPAELKKCLECGERTRGSSKFCPNCGSRFDQPPPIDNEPAPIG